MNLVGLKSPVRVGARHGRPEERFMEKVKGPPSWKRLTPGLRIRPSLAAFDRAPADLETATQS
jgi:hypothetical protein